MFGQPSLTRICSPNPNKLRFSIASRNNPIVLWRQRSCHIIPHRTDLCRTNSCSDRPPNNMQVVERPPASPHSPPCSPHYPIKLRRHRLPPPYKPLLPYQTAESRYFQENTKENLGTVRPTTYQRALSLSQPRSLPCCLLCEPLRTTR